MLGLFFHNRISPYPTFLLCVSLLLLVACKQDTAPATATDAPASRSIDSLQLDIEDPNVLLPSLNVQIQRSPRNYALYEERSQVLYQLGNKTAAIEDIEKAIELFPQGPELHYLRGFYAFTNNDTALAMKQYRRSIELGSDNPENYYQIGQIFFFQQKYDPALKHYEIAARKDSLQPTYLLAQGILYQTRRQYKQAAEAYERALKVAPAFDKALIALHDLYLGAYRQPEKALAYIDQLLEFDPGHALARLYRGNYYFDQALAITSEAQLDQYRTEINNAVGEYSIAIQRDPKLMQAWYNRGYCYFLADDKYDAAISDFEQAVALKPDYAEAHFMLGSIYERFGDKEAALRYYQAALKAKPDFAAAATAVQELQTN